LQFRTLVHLVLQLTNALLFALPLFIWLYALPTPWHYSKLKKEEVIYRGLVCTNIRVLPLHTAYTSRASARDHVTCKTVTLPPPFRESSSSSVIFRNFLPICPRNSYNYFPFTKSHNIAALIVKLPLKGEFPFLKQP
jgi:hypothetical protein